MCIRRTVVLQVLLSGLWSSAGCGRFGIDGQPQRDADQADASTPDAEAPDAPTPDAPTCFDATDWPTEREVNATFDELRQRVVLHGGALGASVSSDTYEWDGMRWYFRSNTGPAIRAFGFAYSVVDQRAVTVGGLLTTTSDQDRSSQVWGWNGVDWMRFADSARQNHGSTLAYDPVRAKILYASGSDGSSNRRFADWTSGVWSSESVLGLLGPPQVWDGVKEVVVSFGGVVPATSSAPSSIMRSRIGGSSTWSVITPSTSPSPRHSHSLSFDPLRRRVVMYGGYSDLASQLPLTETWEWNGSDWSLMAPTTSPPASSGALVYDAVRQETLFIHRGTGFIEMWSWNGSRWLELRRCR